MDPDTQYCPACGLSVTGEVTLPLPTLTQVLRQATLGEYEILEEVGQGGMATVYLAHEIALDRRVAIKVMAPHFIHGPDSIERFKREARTAASLNHPHILPIYAVRESGHLLYFIMKYVTGRSLDAILRSSEPLAIPLVRSVLADAGAALEHAHRQGVVHRDVKPGNILIDEDGFAFLTDFGIALAAQGEALTRSGTTVGTPNYLAPEICTGEVAGPAADQYALGVLGFEMLTGRLPFTADSSLGMMFAHVHHRAPAVDDLRPDCPPDLREGIARMLAKAPGDRFPSLREAVQVISGGRARVSGELHVSDDQIRTEIGRLATDPAAPRPLGRRSTPTSPTSVRLVPFRPKVSAPVPAARVRLSEVLSGLFLVALGAGAAWLSLRMGAFPELAQEPAPPPMVDTAPPPPVLDREDSVLLVAHGAADYARGRAMAAGAPEAVLATGDSLTAVADSLARDGMVAEATLLLGRATSLWGTAEMRAQSETAARNAARTTAARTTRDRPPAPAKPKPPTDSAAVAAYYRDVERAIEARQLGEVRRLLPNLTDSEARDWRRLFEDDKIARLEPQYQVQRVSRSGGGEQIYAGVRETLRLVRRDGRWETKRDSRLAVRLTLGPQGWREIDRERADS